MTCFSNEANSLLKDCKQLLQSQADQDPYAYPAKILGLEGTTKIFQLHYDLESTKEKQIFVLDTCWDDLPLPVAEIPAHAESHTNSPKQSNSPKQVAVSPETDIPMATTQNKPEPTSPPTMAAPTQPTSETKNEECPTTPATEQPTLAQPSKPANQPARKSARKPLFQQNPDTTATGSAKKSKKEN